MALENLLFRVEDGVGIATLNRPKALNALDSRTLRELGELLSQVEADRAVRALVLTGAGDKAFVAGADIAEMSGLSALEARRFAEAGQRTLERLEALPIVTIAAVNGFALGGGCELAMACDLVYASEKARFGQPEVNLGIIPGFGGTQRLQRRVGSQRAFEMIVTGDMADAATARAWGLALDVLPPDRLLPHAVAQARKVMSKGPGAIAAAKRILRATAQPQLVAGQALEAEAFGLLFGTEDGREGLKAFVEKRPAAFQGK
ncbi:MAG: enoyl-CoA hydratase/isomerase family protein [Deltaproteobacteria bacterium]|nr:enoyl-CoA hydratase/isomerase family protein [Deltaproteobacteria bacterium]